MPLSLQVKLLRVIQERSVRPIGGTEDIPFDVRIITATHQNLEHLVQEGRFREDLYYRISVIGIRIPPLRERPEDIVALTHYFLQGRKISKAALKKLGEHIWKGNVRELQNVLERSKIFARGLVLEESDLRFNTFIEYERPPTPTPAPAPQVTILKERETLPPPASIPTFKLIQTAYLWRLTESFGGNKLQATRALHPNQHVTNTITRHVRAYPHTVQILPAEERAFIDRFLETQPITRHDHRFKYLRARYYEYVIQSFNGNTRLAARNLKMTRYRLQNNINEGSAVSTALSEP